VRPLRFTLVEFAPSGGLFQFAFQLGEGLCRHGHAVEILTGPGPELRPATAGLAVTEALPTWHPGRTTTAPQALRRARRVYRGLRYLRAWVRVNRHVARTRPDVVLLSATRFALDGWFTAWLAQRSPATVALIAHEPVPLSRARRTDALHRPAGLMHRALGQAYRAVDVVFVLGDQARRDLLLRWPRARRVEVIPHGDEQALAIRPVPPAEAAPPRILFFGTWRKSKGLDVLLRAFAGVRSRVPEAQLTITGAPTTEVDVDEIRRSARRLGAVTVRPGYVPADQVSDVMGAHRIVVVPYRRAAQSGVVHLAHTFGRPVVASAVGDIPAVVAQGMSGLLVPPDDPAALAAALVRLLRDPAEAGRLGRAARARLASEASWETVASRLLQAIHGAREPLAEAGR
jgi:glycosyltransferase involved in cell wall biosynthesis